MTDSVTRTNKEVLERLTPLFEAVANGRAFRAMIEDLNNRKPLHVPKPHLGCVLTLQAALLRALIGSVCASLDPPAGDRASIGQILKTLNNSPEILKELRGRNPSEKPDSQLAALKELTRRYDEFVKTAAYNDVKELRHAKVAHILMEESPPLPYELIYKAQDECEKLVQDLYGFCRYGMPPFEEAKKDEAKIFWDTYLGAIPKTQSER